MILPSQVHGHLISSSPTTTLGLSPFQSPWHQVPTFSATRSSHSTPLSKPMELKTTHNVLTFGFPELDPLSQLAQIPSLVLLFTPRLMPVSTSTSMLPLLHTMFQVLLNGLPLLLPLLKVSYLFLPTNLTLWIENSNPI